MNLLRKSDIFSSAVATAILLLALTALLPPWSVSLPEQEAFMGVGPCRVPIQPSFSTLLESLCGAGRLYI